MTHANHYSNSNPSCCNPHFCHNCSSSYNCECHHYCPDNSNLVHKLVDAHFSILRAATHCIFHGIESLMSHPNCSNKTHAYNPSHGHQTSSCYVPEPCWMPLPLGDVCCNICTTETAKVELVVTNEDYQPRTFNFEAGGDHGSYVSFSKRSVHLGPKERTKVLATFQPPGLSNHQKHVEYDILLWIKGCRDHYLRWTVNVTKQRHQSCCHVSVCVKDQPDYEIHWYDHFYCQRDCCEL